MKKIFALLLAVVLVLGLFAGCAQSGTNGSSNAGSNNGGSNAGSDSGEIPTLTWYMVGGGMPSNIDSWTEKVNAYLEEKIGAHLDIQCVSWGDWGNRRTNVVSTNEPYDLMFTDMGSFVSDVKMGAFADISDLISEVPGLTDLIPEAYLDACRIDGKLYGIPAYKDSSMTNFFVWTKEYVDEYFPGYADAHTLADCTEGLKAMKEGKGEPPVLLNQDGISCITGNKYDSMGLGSIGLGVSYHSGSTDVVAVYEQEDVLADLRIVHSWMQDGLINSDAAVKGEATGMCGMGIAQGWPSAAAGWGDGRGAEVVVSQYEDTVVSNDTVQGSMTCIAASSKHKLEALKLLELVNTDYKLRDMLAYGEEGVNFEYVEENGERRVNKLNNDWTLAAYTQGTFFDMTLTAGATSNYYVDEVKVQNDNAIASPAMGFVCNTDSIADEIAACKAVFEEYKSLINTGTADPDEVCPEMMAKMRAAGFDKIQAEVQAQFDAWLALK